MALLVGIQHLRDDVNPQAPNGAPMSIIGLIGTAPGADVAAFPLNTPVMVRTNDSALRALLGTTGTIVDALEGISTQMDDETTAAQVVVVRITDNADPWQVITNIVGNEASQTGLWAFLKAGEDIGYEPRLLIAPGYTSQQQNGVTGVTMGTLGTGYTSAPTVGFSGGGGTGAAGTANLTNGIALAIGAGGTGYTTAPTLTIPPPPAGGVQATATCTVSGGIINSVNVTNPGSGYLTPPTVTVTPTSGGTGGVINASLTGRVGSVTITNPGTGYTSAPTVSFTGGGGSAAAGTAAIGALANPVVALLPTIAGRLNGHYIPDGPTNTEQAWINWLETIAETSSCLHPLAQAGQKLNSSGNTVTVPLSPYIAGLYSKVDAENDGRPFRSVANRPLLGLVGVTPTIPFSFIDGSSKGQDYIERKGGIVARGQSGVIGAVARSGFVFWGDSTLSSDTNYLFANVARGRTFIELTNASAQAYYLGKFNITAQVATAIANTLEGILSIAKAEGEVLDYKLSFDPGLNTPGELRQGKLDITFNAEEAPTLRKVTFRSRRYEKALTNLTQQIAIQLGGVTQA